MWDGVVLATVIALDFTSMLHRHYHKVFIQTTGIKSITLS